MKKMKKILIIFAATIIFFSGCIDQKNQKTVKLGDNVSIDFTGSINGTVFDTSIDSVAKENNLPNKTYKPLRFIVGKEKVIKGLDEGIVGMKVGESKTLTIPPEMAYGQKDPQLVQIVPIIQNMSVTRSFPKFVDIPIDQFGEVFGANRKIGDRVQIPETNNSMIIKDLTTSNVVLTYDFKVGDKISKLAPWNETVIKIDDNNITTKSGAKKDDIIIYPGAVWNTTIIDINSDNITLKHNRIPETKVRIPAGNMRVHFNDTHIILDVNNEYAGEILTFDVTIRSIG